jgi:hypothetical protein
MKHSIRVFTALVLLGILSLLSLAFRPLLQTTDWSSLPVVLLLIAAGPLALYLAGKGLAYLFEIIPGWGTKVPAVLRPYIVLAVAAALMFGADFLLAQSVLVASIEPIYRKFAILVLLWVGSQKGYGEILMTGMRQPRALKLP